MSFGATLKYVSYSYDLIIHDIWKKTSYLENIILRTDSKVFL